MTLLVPENQDIFDFVLKNYFHSQSAVIMHEMRVVSGPDYINVGNCDIDSHGGACELMPLTNELPDELVGDLENLAVYSTFPPRLRENIEINEPGDPLVHVTSGFIGSSLIAFYAQRAIVSPRTSSHKYFKYYDAMFNDIAEAATELASHTRNILIGLDSERDSNYAQFMSAVRRHQGNSVADVPDLHGILYSQKDI